jgi:hypothetical protein
VGTIASIATANPRPVALFPRAFVAMGIKTFRPGVSATVVQNHEPDALAVVVHTVVPDALSTTSRVPGSLRPARVGVVEVVRAGPVIVGAAGGVRSTMYVLGADGG